MAASPRDARMPLRPKGTATSVRPHRSVASVPYASRRSPVRLLAIRRRADGRGERNELDAARLSHRAHHDRPVVALAGDVDSSVETCTTKRDDWTAPAAA